MHGKYSFVETLIERLIQQVRKHEKQAKAYDEAFTAMKKGSECCEHCSPWCARADDGHRSQCERCLDELPGMWEHADLIGGETDANPERRGNGCAIYRVNS